ncbi:hypothetical protein CTAYLR_004604 [Chrysophaeum taylorii]|uniref:Uncharacterized protein n=1 Tax=Chrysophaeum taylorii TaxID=2483200 RepID=A0AAD7XLR9_9STRA|nr:hypothetical protein CTAYLR_004604 [Chrysophaeum taylorii]
MVLATRLEVLSLLAASVPLDQFPRLDEGSRGSNILTSRPLELLRIQRQLDADDRYNELADPNERSSPASRLARIVVLSDAFKALRPAIAQGGPSEWRTIAETLGLPPFDKQSFKRTFNAYSDNIYYSDPDRANVYLLGGTPPSNQQTIQYLHRNDALDNIEQLRSELDYLILEQQTDVSDALAFHAKAVDAFDAYLALAPDADLKAAERLKLRIADVTSRP